MNHFLKLKIWEKDRWIAVRPEHVAAVISEEGQDYATIVLVTGDSYWVEHGQFTLSTLINHTGHAGMRVL
jgi:hypothetical protein